LILCCVIVDIHVVNKYLPDNTCVIAQKLYFNDRV